MSYVSLRPKLSTQALAPAYAANLRPTAWGITAREPVDGVGKLRAEALALDIGDGTQICLEGEEYGPGLGQARERLQLHARVRL